MAEGTYEYECERAELLGINPPNRADWEEADRVRKESELAQQMTVWLKKIKQKKIVLYIFHMKHNICEWISGNGAP